ncbi:MAG: hypothetical protein WCQ60_02000 [bacterium]
MWHAIITNQYLWIPFFILIGSLVFISFAFIGDYINAELVIWYPVWIPAAFLVSLAIVTIFPQTTGLALVLFSQVPIFLGETFLIWFPFLLLIATWRMWMQYIRAKFIAKLKFVLLELKVPQEVTKSPLAMETFLMSLHQTGMETTFLDRHWKGNLRAYYSLEIISVEGDVKFYIYTQERFKKFIEAGLYAHYQNIEIHEVPDYSHSVSLDKNDLDMYIIDYKKKSADPLPIKTYVDYGIDNEQMEEETKIDPISTVVEFLGSIGANQQCWLQFVIRAHKKEQKKAGTFFEKTDRWKDEAKKEIEKIRAAALPKGSDGTKFPNPTKGEQERIAAIERGQSKLSFDVGIRSIYMGKKGFFNGTNITGQRTLLRSYHAAHLNNFGPTNWLDGFDYPWEDFRGIRKSIVRRHGLEAYKRRAFFYGPHSEHSAIMVLSVEELASLFHLPGQVVQTPTMGRLVSKKGQAPGNLPI